MYDSFPPVRKRIAASKGDMVRTLSSMIRIKAIPTQNGGAGESKRADFLQHLLESWGFAVRRYSYADKTGTERPNLVTKLGSNTETIWVLAHMDTVTEGDASAWRTDPFDAKVQGGKIYGRGTNDNGQEVIASIFALKALKESRAKLRYNMGVVLVADEENGSDYGIKKLLKEGIFKKSDMFVVPDFGKPKGDWIEISEKSILWLKIAVKGKQVHASSPGKGVNAYRYAIRFLSCVDEFLHTKYSRTDKPFGTPSTFEMTKHEKNVDSVNILPGTDVSYIDCRIMPRYSPDDVLKDVESIARRKEFAKAKIRVSVQQKDYAARPMPENAKIVKGLKKALKDLRGINAICVGIGGGTVANPIRRLGIHAAVWSTQDNVAHMPNEFTRTRYMVEDAKVFAYLCTHG